MRILVLLLLISSSCIGQTPPGYTKIFTRYDYLALKNDSGFHVPGYSTVPNIRSGVWPGAGNIGVDTVANRLYFYSNGSWRYSTAGTGGGTPTLQQTLTAGGTLTTDNTIDGSAHDFTFAGINELNLGSGLVSSLSGLHVQSGEADLQAFSDPYDGRASFINVYLGQIGFSPNGGEFYIDTLNKEISQNKIMGWTSTTGVERGTVGYLDLGAGLSISSGTLNTSGTVATPLSSLTAATTSNDIDNLANSQVWRWSTLANSTGLTLLSTSTAAAANPVVLTVATQGANSSSSQTTIGAQFVNTHTGTTSTNIGAVFSASGATNNYGLIVTNGNVGIGTSVPTHLLEVSGGTIYGRWQARVGSTTSSATPTINTDNVDAYKITALAANITSFTTNLSGTPNDLQVLEITITDDGTSRTLAFGSSFVSSTVTIPAATTISTTLTIIFQYYTTSSYGNNKWICTNYY